MILQVAKLGPVSRPSSKAAGMSCRDGLRMSALQRNRRVKRRGRHAKYRKKAGMLYSNFGWGDGAGKRVSACGLCSADGKDPSAYQ